MAATLLKKKASEHDGLFTQALDSGVRFGVIGEYILDKSHCRCWCWCGGFGVDNSFWCWSENSSCLGRHRHEHWAVFISIWCVIYGIETHGQVLWLPRTLRQTALYQMYSFYVACLTTKARGGHQDFVSNITAGFAAGALLGVRSKSCVNERVTYSCKHSNGHCGGRGVRGGLSHSSPPQQESLLIVQCYFIIT